MSIDPHCRIGKVKPIAANVAIFPKKPRTTICKKLVDYTTDVCDNSDFEIKGYALVVFDELGNSYYSYHTSDLKAIEPIKLPEIVKNILERAVGQ